MRHSQLKAFHAVALHGGFSRAADVLHLTQPALSEQVRKLEQAHDVLLFHRDHKRVELTATGEQLFRRTRQLFEIEQQIAEFMSESRASLDGTLRIMADSAHHLTNTLKAFRAQHPKVFVSVRTGNSEDVLAALRNYDAEIGFVGSARPGSDMIAHDLGTSPIIAMIAKNLNLDLPKPLKFKGLAGLPLVFREAGSRTRQRLEEEAARHNITFSPVVEVEGREAMRDVVASGAGLGFVSSAEFGSDSRLRQIAIDEPALTMSEAMIYLRQRRDVRLIRAFAGLAVNEDIKTL